MGSTLVARWAGNHAAIRVTRAMARVAAMKVRGSVALRPKSCDWTARPAKKAAGMPIDYADGEKDERFFEDHPEDAVGLCAEGDADADLVGTADDVVGHDAVEADAGEDHGEEREDAGEGGDEFFVVHEI